MLAAPHNAHLGERLAEMKDLKIQKIQVRTLGTFMKNFRDWRGGISHALMMIQNGSKGN